MVIQIVEDDRALSDGIVLALKEPGHKFIQDVTVKSAKESYGAENPELIILDVNLPDGSGYDYLKWVREHSQLPVLMLTANDMEMDEVMGLTLGADDYVTKPFHISVFRKKVSALLARIQKQAGGETYDDGNLSIHFSEMTADFLGEPIAFTSMEYRLLKVLVQNPQTVLTRQVLLEKLWDCDRNFVDEHALTVAISRIRSKIERNGSQYIKTVYGMGYMWIGGRIK